MSLLDEALARRLERRRLRTRWVGAAAPDGERRGSVFGTGMEFADHREYQEGDDLRHLDVHAYARLGRPYIKRFSADRGLDVAVLVDASASMNFGHPSKLHVAGRLGMAVAYAAASSGDRVRLATFGAGQDVRWRPSVTSKQHVRTLEGGLTEFREAMDGESDLRAVAVRCDAELPSAGVTVVLSDWWTDDPEGAVHAFSRTGRELVAVQVLAPEEVEPARLERGMWRFIDAEGGDSVDVPLGEDAQHAYALELAAWQTGFRRAVDAAQGRCFTVRTDRDVNEVVLEDWREAGFVA